MKDSTLGILIIIFFIIMGIVSQGSIFRPATDADTTSTDDVTSSPYYNDSSEYEYEQERKRRELQLISAEAIELNEQIQEQVAAENASQYIDRVSIANIYNVGTFNEYAVLSVRNDPGQSIVLSGWKLKSLVTGGEMTIGGATNIPEYGLPSDAPIVITDRRARVIVNHAISPINKSFRVNICAGYLDPNNNLVPPLARQCPSAYEDAPPVSVQTNNECLDYIDTIPLCRIPRERDLPEELSRSCKDYIEENVNYISCVRNHQFDEDFFIPEWRVFSKVRGILWIENRDVIQLIDNTGKVVDTYRFDNR